MAPQGETFFHFNTMHGVKRVRGHAPPFIGKHWGKIAFGDFNQPREANDSFFRCVGMIG